MASSTAAAVGSSRGDPLSCDRLDLLDLDELVKKSYDKSNENSLLEQQLLQLEHYRTTVMAALRCSDATELDSLLQQLTPHPSRMKEQAVSTLHCVSLKQWSYTEDCLALHKMLGTEIVTVSVEKRFIINIHCYEDNYPHLPPKLLVIEEIPNTNMFKIKPREILLNIDCDPELRNRMLRSSEQEITNVFRQVQSQIFDTVDRDNIYQHLKSQELIKHTLTCNMNRSLISFLLSRHSGGVVMPNTGVDREGNNVTFIIQNYLSVLLFVEPSKDSGWCVNITCFGDVELEKVPAPLRLALTAFALEVSQGSVIDAFTTLLRQMKQLAQVRDTDDTSSSADDEFAALF